MRKTEWQLEPILGSEGPCWARAAAADLLAGVPTASECSDNLRAMQANKDHKGLSKWEIQRPGATDSSHLAVLAEVIDLTGSPTQLASQPASQPVGRRLMYDLPSSWSAVALTPQPEPATKKAAPTPFKTWCGVRITVLGLYLTGVRGYFARI
ncbi:hypothetical protein WJX77_006581 [Trebouxia sp. C0004]